MSIKPEDRPAFERWFREQYCRGLVAPTKPAAGQEPDPVGDDGFLTDADGHHLVDGDGNPVEVG